MRRPARDGQAEVGQGQRVVQDRRAQLVDPDRGQAVVAGQAAELVGSPQSLVIAACAAGPGVGDVDEAERRRVLEEDAQRIPAFHDVPGPRAGVAERAVVRVGDVEPPQGPQAPGRDQRRLLSPEQGEHLAHAGPRAGCQRGQSLSHGGAPGDGRGQRAGLALALDGVDAGQLVVRHAPQPPVPQGRERLVRRAGQRRAAARRELEPRAGQPGQAAEPGSAAATRTPRWARRCRRNPPPPGRLRPASRSRRTGACWPRTAPARRRSVPGRRPDWTARPAPCTGQDRTGSSAGRPAVLIRGRWLLLPSATSKP